MAYMIFLLPVLAVLLSMGFILLFKPQNEHNIKLLLAFSGAFLLALSFFELLPKVYHAPHHKSMALFILAGILLQVLLESFSKGAEHGHVHMRLKENQFPILLFLSLSLHALAEGFPITEDGAIIYGILVHKVPIALILGIFLVNSKLKTFHTVLFMVLFSLMTPLGTYLALHTDFMQKYSPQLNALAVGIFLHVSTVILFESSQGHAFNLRKLVVIVLGVTIAYFL